MKTVRRISRIIAFFIVYIACAYMYLSAKGFVFDGRVPYLSNEAIASNSGNPIKLKENVQLGKSMARYLGDENAPLTMYDFSSMACSHCGDFHNHIFPKIKRDFIDTGKLRFVFVHFPLEEKSMVAAKFAYCMPEDKYYEFISVLYHKKDWFWASENDVLENYAKQVGLSTQDIENCKNNKVLTSDILRVREVAIKSLGINATPSFVVSGNNENELLVGSRSYDDIKDYLQERLGVINE